MPAGQVFGQSQYMISRRAGAISILLLTVILFAGCSSISSVASSAANAVTPTSAVITHLKNFVVPGFPSTTVGKAFEGTFQNAKWTTFETAKGQTIVQFDGTVTVKALEVQNQFRFSRSSLGCETSLGLEQDIMHLAQKKNDIEDEYRSGLKAAQMVRANNWPSNRGTFTPEQLILNEAYSTESQRLTKKNTEDVESLKNQVAAIDAKVTECQDNASVPVQIMFSLDADKSFSLAFINGTAFNNGHPVGGEISEEVFKFIYQ